MKHLAAALVALVLSANAYGAVPPLEPYGQLPTLSNVTLSPDGTEVAYAKSANGKNFIVLQQIGVKQPLAVVGAGDEKLRDIRWADDTHLLITTSMAKLPVGVIGRRGEFYVTQVFNLQDRSFHSLLDDANNKNLLMLNVVAGLPETRTIGGRTVVFVPGIYFDSHGTLALFSVDLTAHEIRLVSSKADPNAQSWVIDQSGNIVAVQDYYEDDQQWAIRLYRNGAIVDGMKMKMPLDGPYVEGLSEDGGSVVVSLPQAEDWRAYKSVSIKDSASATWAHDDLHLRGLLVDPNTDRVIGGSRYADKSDYVFFDPHTDLVWRSIKAAFKDATDVDCVSHSTDWSKVVVRVFGPNYGDTYYFVDMKTHQASVIGSVYDGIQDVAQEKWIAYSAADGRTIQAYLTLPPGRDPKNLPLIVLPHGGPHARDEPGFDWISQALASRGYAVLQPQFRGSGGFGKDLLWAGFGEFGRKMQTDLSDGVRAVAAQGVIDPKRVCIVGASYGGYAALAGATLDTGVYRCAVSIAGLSDLARFLTDNWSENRFDNRGERFWDRFLGVAGPNDPKLDEISPIKHVDKVSIPILLIHGRDDTVVPFFQSEEMVSALKAAGKPVEFVELEHEDHWLSRGDTRLQMLQATVKFLEANNPPN